MMKLSFALSRILYDVCRGYRSFAVTNPAFARVVREALQPKEVPEGDGVTVDLVKPLNPEIHIPVSGGLDSTVLYYRNREAVIGTYYYDFGQSYADKEMAALHKLCIEYNRVEGPLLREVWQHIIPGRNLYIVLDIADKLDVDSAILMGVVDGELVEKGGDKSAEFFRLLKPVLAHYPVAISVELPLLQETKTDLVRWWLEQGLPESMLHDTISCFGAQSGHCGSCLACLRKWVAFKNNGLELKTDVPVAKGCDQHIRRLHSQMSKALLENDFSVFTHRRCMQTLKAFELL